MAQPNHEEPVEPPIRELLLELFNMNEFDCFIRDHYREVSVHVASGTSPYQRANEFVDALRRRGQLDDDFFTNLRRERPNRRDRIAVVQRGLAGLRRARRLPRQIAVAMSVLFVIAGAVGVAFRIDVNSLLGEKQDLVCKNKIGNLEKDVTDPLDDEHNKLSQLLAVCEKLQNEDACREIERYMTELDETRKVLKSSLDALSRTGCEEPGRTDEIEQLVNSPRFRALLADAEAGRGRVVESLTKPPPPQERPGSGGGGSRCPACVIRTCPLTPARATLEQDLIKRYRKECGDWFTALGHRIVIKFSRGAGEDQPLSFKIIKPEAQEIRECLEPETERFLAKYGSAATALVGSPMEVEIWNED